MNRILRAVVRCKVYMDRARMYTGYIQFFMMGGIFLKVMGGPVESLFAHYPISATIVGFSIFLVVCLMIGWIDLKLGVFQEEARRHSSLNPIYRDILAGIAEINEKLKSQTNDTNITRIPDKGPLVRCLNATEIKSLLSQWESGGHDLQPSDRQSDGGRDLRLRDEPDGCRSDPPADGIADLHKGLSSPE